MIDKDKILNWLAQQHNIASNNILEVIDRNGDADEYEEFRIERSVYGLIYGMIVEGAFDDVVPEAHLETPDTNPSTYTDDNAGKQPDDICDTCIHSDEGICNEPNTDCPKVNH